MSIVKKAVIGIAGGMGPQAGINLFDNIVKLTVASTDQQHYSVVLMSFPEDITDRTAFLQGIEPVNPATAIAGVIRKLETAGATVIGIACNTAHAPRIYSVIEDELEQLNSTVQLVNMPYETCRYVKEKHPHIKRVGVMATNGTYHSGVYDNWLAEFGYEVILPDHTFQYEVIHKMIYDPSYGLKANSKNISSEVQLSVKRALQFFKENNAEAVILGCTELSLVIEEGEWEGMCIIDSAMSLARALAREAGACMLSYHYNGFYESGQERPNSLPVVPKIAAD
jgi:aspartate racemase